MLVRLLPKNARLKQLIKTRGDIWEVIKQRDQVQCFNDKGYLIKATDHPHIRWCREDEIEFIEENLFIKE